MLFYKTMQANVTFHDGHYTSGYLKRLLVLMCQVTLCMLKKDAMRERPFT